MSDANKFLRISVEAARKFVQTIVLVDDEAFRPFASNEQGETQILVPPAAEPGAIAQLASVDEPDKGTEPAASAPVSIGDLLAPASAQQVDEGLQAPKLIQHFAHEGLVCAVLQPPQKIEIKDDTIAAARVADVVILDWILHDDGGEATLAFIKTLIADDRGERLRLILIYTGDPDAARIRDRIRTLLGDQVVDDGANALRGTHLRIAVLLKLNSTTKTLEEAVGLDALPGRVLEEFARISSGLVSNIALAGVAAIRRNTHALLARLHPALDAAFLTHRLLLPNPEDAAEFVTDIVADELAHLIHGLEVGSISGMDAIDQWLVSRPTRLRSELGISDKDELRVLVRDGLASLLRARLVPEEDMRKKEKPFHKQSTLMFEAEDARARILDREFAFRASMLEPYKNSNPAAPPVLTLGTVVMQGARFLVCGQPVCDCVRLREATSFIFLEAREDSSPNLIIKNGAGELVGLQIDETVAGLSQLVFASESKDRIVARGLDGGFVFTTAAGDSWIWLGQMKSSYSQRMIQRFSANLARVGLEESEWLRRHGRG